MTQIEMIMLAKASTAALWWHKTANGSANKLQPMHMSLK
jgi:hypothetical protein